MGTFLRHTVGLMGVVSLTITLASDVVNAQSVNVSQVTGVIRDSTGASIPGATVTITKTDTGLERSVISGEDGAYSIPRLRHLRARWIRVASGNQSRDQRYPQGRRCERASLR